MHNYKRILQKRITGMILVAFPKENELKKIDKYKK
jgi:hypothetical protein